MKADAVEMDRIKIIEGPQRGVEGWVRAYCLRIGLAVSMMLRVVEPGWFEYRGDGAVSVGPSNLPARVAEGTSGNRQDRFGVVSRWPSIWTLL
jgi:hypothetical protein